MKKRGSDLAIGDYVTGWLPTPGVIKEIKDDPSGECRIMTFINGSWAQIYETAIYELIATNLPTDDTWKHAVREAERQYLAAKGSNK